MALPTPRNGGAPPPSPPREEPEERIFHGLAAARGRLADPEALRAEQERDLDRFALILEAARRADSSPRDLFKDTLRLTRPDLDDGERRRLAERYDELMAVFRDAPERALGQDRHGNPRWISLTPREEREGDGRIKPEGVLPSERESAAPGALDSQAPASGGKEGLLERLFGTGKKTSGSGEDIRRARDEYGVVPPLRPRPMRSFLRMLLFAAIFAAVYYALLRFGFIRPLR